MFPIASCRVPSACGWAIVDLRGKAGHVRTIPVPDWVTGLLKDWTAAAGIEAGSLFRRVSSAGEVALGFAAPPAANWSRSNFSLGTFPCRQPSGTSVVPSGSHRR